MTLKAWFSTTRRSWAWKFHSHNVGIMNIAYITGFYDVPGRIHLDFHHLTTKGDQKTRARQTSTSWVRGNLFGCTTLTEYWMALCGLECWNIRSWRYMPDESQCFHRRVCEIYTHSSFWSQNTVRSKPFTLDRVSVPWMLLICPPASSLQLLHILL